MSRQNTGEQTATSPLSPYQTPPIGVPMLGAVPPLSYAGQPIPPGPSAKAVPTPKGLLNAFKRRWVLGTFVALLISVAAATVLWLALPAGKHEARGLISLRDRSTTDVTSRNAEDYDSYRKNQIFIIKTRELLNRTVNDPAVASLETIKNSEDPAHMLEESITVKDSAPSIVSVTMKGNNVEDMRVIVDALMKRYVEDTTAVDRTERAEQIKKLEKMIQTMSAEIDADERKIRMTIRGSGAFVGSGETGTNSTDFMMQRILQLDQLVDFINKEITARESELRIVEQQLGWFKLSDKSMDELKASGVPSSVLDRLKVLREREFKYRRFFLEELTKVLPKDELDHWKSSILNVAQLPSTQQPIVPEGEVIERINKDARIVKLDSELSYLRARLQNAESIATKPETNPEVLGLKEDVEKKKKEVDAKKLEIKSDVYAAVKSSALASLQTRVNILEENIAVLKETRNSHKLDKDSLVKTRAGMAESNGDVAVQMKGLIPKLEMVAEKKKELVQFQAQSTMDAKAKIRETAQPLLNNNLNKKMLFSTVLGLGTFAMVILMVAFLEWRTRRVDGVDQVVDELGMRIIGTVPAFPNRASLKIAAEVGGANWRFALNESINSTRTMLLHTARSQSMQVVMVTSATQGEGKTSITSQLATSMATAGMRTLIVDCDLRNPSIHKLFDIGMSPGVSEILLQEVDPSDAIQPTSVPNLWVIPAGQCSNRVVAALAQGHPLETLFNRLRGQFDFVIVDSCPVLPVADALLIGQHVDGVLFSIMQDISQIPKVVLASEKLNQLNIPLLGAVVNGIKQDVYSYGYNYVKQLPA